MAKPKSIKGRLSGQLALGLGGLLVLSATGLALILDQQTTARFDETVLHRARSLITLTRVVDGVIEFEFADEFMPEFKKQEGPEYFQVQLRNGAILEQSYSLLNRTLPRLELQVSPIFVDVALDPGGRCRMVQIAYIPEDETRDVDGSLNVNLDDPRLLILNYAQSRAPLDGFLLRTKVAIALLFGVMLLSTLIIVRRVVTHGLEPLNELGRVVGKRQPGNLGQVIALHHEPLELKPVIEQLNKMLTRLESAMERERQFTANVAHELRTPIAELRTVSEVAGALNIDENIREFFSDVREISMEMEQLVKHLFALSRYDLGQIAITSERFDIVPLLHKIIRRKAPVAEARNMNFVLDIPDQLPITSDENLVEVIIQNVIQNAVSHGQPDHAIKVRVQAPPEDVLLSIGNVVDGLDEDDLNKMHLRFWQKDEARTGGNHTGLGLSMVHAINKLLGFRLELKLEDQWFWVQIIMTEAKKEEPANASKQPGPGPA